MKFKRNQLINFLLAVLVSAVWIRYKSLSLVDSIICFVVVFFVLYSIDTFSTFIIYKAQKKGKDSTVKQKKKK